MTLGKHFFLGLRPTPDLHDDDRKLLEDGARPIIMWNRASICMQPYVKGYVANVNSVYNGFRFEDVWLDK